MFILPQPELSKLSSLRLGGRAVALLGVEALEDLATIPKQLQAFGVDVPKILGGGTNILAQDGALPWVLVKNCWLPQPRVMRSSKLVQVQVSCAFPLPRLVAWGAKRGLAGLAGLAGVPGQVGGAVAGNAGAMGQELGNLWQKLGVYTPETGLVEVDRLACECSYRHFALPQGLVKSWYLLVWVEFNFVRQARAEILTTIRTNWQRKLSTQPVRALSAGCIFKNPEGFAAGQLLEAAGFRGKEHEGVAFSEQHANFLVNKGQGQAKAALELIEAARTAVLAKTGLELELEVQLWLC